MVTSGAFPSPVGPSHHRAAADRRSHDRVDSIVSIAAAGARSQAEDDNRSETRLYLPQLLSCCAAKRGRVSGPAMIRSQVTLRRRQAMVKSEAYTTSLNSSLYVATPDTPAMACSS